MKQKLEILCVDDEPQVLEGLRLHLKQSYVVHLATSGADGLALLRENRNVAVVLSDMRMPVMDGAKFLNGALNAAPDAVRMLLTGYTDMPSAVAAVNEGQIFRFISKPCPPDQLLGAFKAAVIQHQLIVAEKVLLQQTLLGCVESLSKVLSITKPIAFGRALRLRSKVRSAVRHLGWPNAWQVEAAAMLSQLGAVTLSEDVLLKLNDGEEIDETDRRDIASSITTSIVMLENIPRLEPVIEILKSLVAATPHTNGSAAASPDSPGSLLLQLVMQWDSLEAQGFSQADALRSMAAADEPRYRELLATLKDMTPGAKAQRSAISLALPDLRPGMVLAQDLVCNNGVVVLPRGFEIDRGLLEHVFTFAGELAGSTVMVLSD